MATLDVGEDPFVRGVVAPLSPVAVLVSDIDLLVGAVEQDVPLRLRELAEGRVEIDPVGLADRVEHAVPILERRAGPRREDPLVDGKAGIGNDQFGIDLEPGAQAVARRACPVR